MFLLPPPRAAFAAIGGAPVQRLTVILFVAAALALGGCFMSSSPLITPATADHPWSKLRAKQSDWRDGKWQAQGNIALSREGAYYRLEDEKSHDVTRFLVRQIGDHAYVTQSQDTSGSGDASYSFALLVADGNRVYQYSFDDLSKRCAIPGIDAAALRLKPYEDGCGVPSLEALTQIFTTLQKAPPRYEVMYETTP